MPGRGEILELRRDDPRNQEGYRSFMFGAYVRGMPGLDEILDRVNADLESDARRVTWEQLDAANPCLIIYHRDDGWRHNGSCDRNPTDERVTYASYCGDGRCQRWPMTGGRVYRVPARPRLTPGERAEEMVRTLDGTTVTETVPAPAELGSWLTELSDAMGEEQPPTNDQVRNVIGAVGRALTRAESASTADADAETAPASAPAIADAADMTIHEDEVPVPGTSEDETALRPTSAEDGTLTSSTSAGAATSWSTNPIFLWLIIATLSLAVILLLFKDKILRWYRPVELDESEKTPAPAPVPPSLTREQEHGLKMFGGLKRRWKQYYDDIRRADAQARVDDRLTMENLFLFFDTADTNRVLVNKLDKDLLSLREQEETFKTAKAQVADKDARLARLQQEIGKASSELALAQSRASAADAARSDAEAKVLQIGLESQAKLTAKSKELESERDRYRALQAEFDAFKEKAMELAMRLQQEAMAGVHLGIETAVKVGDDSKPSLLLALERVHHVKEQFDAMVQGVYNDLLLHIAPDLALVPAPVGAPLVFQPTTDAKDSWTGPIDDSVLELAAERTSHGSLIPGFGGMHGLDASGSESVPPRKGESIPALESLKSEPTNPGVGMPALATEPVPTDDDNVAFRPSKHPLTSSKPKRGLRGRKTTDSFERAPVKQALAEKRVEDESPVCSGEQTAVIDPKDLELRKLEARTGKTITPGMTLAARDDSPIPGSLLPPPPPVVNPAADHGEEPDPTEVGSKPASLSIFDDLPGSSEETGVTVKRAVGKD